MPTADPHGALQKLLISAGILAVCTALHAAGVVALGRWLKGRAEAAQPAGYAGELWSIVCVAWTLVGLHVVSILLWALTYAGLGCLPDLGTAFYFSATTYTTVGYGDVVLPAAWRTLSGAEALCGIFLAGLSTAFFFAVLSKALQHRLRP